MMRDSIFGMDAALKTAKDKGIDNMVISAPLVLEMGVRVLTQEEALFNAEKQLREAESILREMDVLRCASDECNCGSYH